MALGLAFFTACTPAEKPVTEPAATDVEAVVDDAADAAEGTADDATEVVEEAAAEVEDAM